MLNHNPLVSVIIPTYNRRDNLLKAIRSVFGQTYHNFEVIVIDDGSTDDTGEKLRGIYGDRISYTLIDHQGPAVARNIGIKISQGEYIALLDSDDLWLPEKLEFQVNNLRHNEKIGLVWSNVIFSYSDSSYATNYKDLDNFNIQDGLLKNCLIETSSVLIRKCILMEVGLFDENIYFHETWDLFYRLRRVADFNFTENSLAMRVCHDGNMVYDRTKRERFLKDTEYFLNKLFSFPENKNKQEMKERCLGNIYRWIGAADIRHDYNMGKAYLWKSLQYELNFSVLLTLLRYSYFGGVIRSIKTKIKL